MWMKSWNESRQATILITTMATIDRQAMNQRQHCNHSLLKGSAKQVVIIVIIYMAFRNEKPNIDISTGCTATDLVTWDLLNRVNNDGLPRVILVAMGGRGGRGSLTLTGTVNLLISRKSRFFPFFFWRPTGDWMTGPKHVGRWRRHGVWWRHNYCHWRRWLWN